MLLKIIPFFFLILVTLQNSVAQSLNTSKDTAILLELISMPSAAPEFNLTFSANSLKNIAPKSNKQVKSDIKDLEDSLEVHPHDINLILKIVAAYKNRKDMRNYEVYLQYAFKNAMKAYETSPDSFGVVLDLVNVLTEGGDNFQEHVFEIVKG